jgi:nucleoside-triphosphatase THEP1
VGRRIGAAARLDQEELQWRQWLEAGRSALPPSRPAPPAAGRLHRVLPLFLLPGCLVLLMRGSLGESGLALLVWVGVLAVSDRPALGRLWMPRFWLFTVVIAAFSGMLLGEHDLRLLGLPLSTEGLRAGARMVLRGAFLFAVATWASRALLSLGAPRRPSSGPLGQLGQSVVTALHLLPGLQVWLSEQAPSGAAGKRRLSLAHLRALLTRLAEATYGLAYHLEDRDADPSGAVLAIVGAPGSGKTTVLRRAAEHLAAAGLSVGGIVQPRCTVNHPDDGYAVADAATGERRELARPAAEGRGFRFDEAAWRWARERLLAAAARDECIVVDELGRREAEGAGHLPSLLEARAHHPGRLWLVAVRADRREELERRLGRFAAVFDLADRPGTVLNRPALETLAHEISQTVQRLARSGQLPADGRQVPAPGNHPPSRTNRDI